MSRGRGSRATKGTAAVGRGRAGGRGRGGNLAAVAGVAAVQKRLRCGGVNGVDSGGRSGGRAAAHGIGGVCGPFSRAAEMAAVVAVALPAMALHQDESVGRGSASARQQRRSLRWPRRRLWQWWSWRRCGSNRLSRWLCRNPLQRFSPSPLRQAAVSDSGGGGSGDGGGGSGGGGGGCVFGRDGGGGEKGGRSGEPSTLLVGRGSLDKNRAPARMGVVCFVVLVEHGSAIPFVCTYPVEHWDSVLSIYLCTCCMFCTCVYLICWSRSGHSLLG